MILYLAGPLFTAAELQFNLDLATALEKLGHVVWMPQEYYPDTQTFLAAINQCNCVVVNCDGPDMDSGTAFEAGYAYAKGINIVAYRTDFRKAGDCDLPVNLMVGHTARIFIHPQVGTFQMNLLARNIHEAL
jgi:nucleoside 2-deoxyribosyltransferase